MKKVWIVLLSVYVTLVTVGCALFATLYFMKMNGKDLVKDLTYSEAKTLVHDVYDTQIANFAQSSVSAKDDKYSDYNEDDFDYTLFSMQFGAYQSCLTNCDKTFQNNLATNVWYKHPRQNYELTFLDDNVFRMTIKGQTVSIEVGQPTNSANIQDGTDTVHPGENYITMYFEVTKKSETSWKVDWYNRYYFNIENSSNEEGYHFALWHFVFEAENSKVFSVHFESASTNLKTLKDEITDQDIYSYFQYDCNLKTKKVLLEVGPQELLENDGYNSLPEYTQGLSKTETITESKKLYNDQKKVMGLYFDDEHFA